MFDRWSSYLFCLQVYNKVDQISIEEVDRLARQPNSVVIRSAVLDGSSHHPPFLFKINVFFHFYYPAVA